jgi:hypothetical protein
MFSATSNLDNLTLQHLQSPTSALGETLIRSGQSVAHPLLRSLVRNIAGYGAGIRSESERKRIKADDWSETVFNPLLMPAHQIISQIGEPARYQLCKAIREFDRPVQKAAALLLAIHATEDTPSVYTMTEIRGILWSGKMNDTATVMLLTFVLARGGDASCQQAISEHARDNRMDVDQWAFRTIDTAVLELLGWEKEVLR